MQAATCIKNMKCRIFAALTRFLFPQTRGSPLTPKKREKLFLKTDGEHHYCDFRDPPVGESEASFVVSCECDGERAKATAQPTPATSTTATIRFLSHA